MDAARPPMDKDSGRRRFREERERLPAAVRTAADTALATHVLDWLGQRPESGSGRQLIAAYLSVAPEPGTETLLSALDAAGYDVVVPACEPAYQLSWCRWQPGIPLEKSVRAPLSEPVGPRSHFSALPALKLVLVPGLAMDLAGNRLGQGGGYYDRFLAQFRAAGSRTPTIGYLYDHEVVPQATFVANVLDMPLPGAFTPSGYRVASAEPRRV